MGTFLTGYLRGRPPRSSRRLVFGLLLQPERLDLVGAVAVLGDDLSLGAQHQVVEIPFGGDGAVAGGVQLLLEADLLLARGLQGLVPSLDLVSGIGGVDGGVVADGLQADVGFLVGFQVGGSNADGLMLCHVPLLVSNVEGVLSHTSRLYLTQPSVEPTFTCVVLTFTIVERTLLIVG